MACCAGRCDDGDSICVYVGAEPDMHLCVIIEIRSVTCSSYSTGVMG